MTLVLLACVPDFPGRSFDTSPTGDTDTQTSPPDTQTDTAPDTQTDTAPDTQTDTGPPLASIRLESEAACARAGEALSARITADVAYLLVGGPGVLEGSCDQAGQVWQLDLADLPETLGEPLGLGLAAAGGGALVDLYDGFAVGDPRRDNRGAAVLVDETTSVLLGEADVYADGAALAWDGDLLFVGAPSDSATGGQVIAVSRSAKSLSEGNGLRGDGAEGFGRRLTYAGDLHGHGERTLVVAAPEAGAGDGLLFLVPIGWSDQAQASDLAEVFSGSPGLGRAVAVADIDGDGVQQLIIATDTAVLVLDDLDLSTPASTYMASGFEGFGASVATVDLDRDGVSELLVGAPGTGAVLHAVLENGVHELGDDEVLLEADGDDFGSSVAVVITPTAGWVAVGLPAANDHAGAVELLAY